MSNVVKGIVDIVVGVLSGDWTRALAGLGEIIGGVLAFVAEMVPIVTGGTLVGTFQREANVWTLRNYASGLIDTKYMDSGTNVIGDMRMALGIDSGGFGLHLDAVALRSFIRSDFSSIKDGAPDLPVWLVSNGLDLRTLAGFDAPAWWSRSWPELVGDGGSISSTDIDNYIAMRGVGTDVKQFSLFCMSKSDMQTRLNCADTHLSELGLKFRWSVRDAMLTLGNQVIIGTMVSKPPPPAPEVHEFPLFLETPPFGRTNRTNNLAVATGELSMPMTIGAFGFDDGSLRGISSLFATASCIEANSDGSPASLNGEGITGTAFRYVKPDIGFKYTVIHELGHTFGLCHVNGLLRIMFTNAMGQKKSIWSWPSAWQYWTNGVEAGFTLEEGKKAWDYIVANFAPAQLQVRPF